MGLDLIGTSASSSFQVIHSASARGFDEGQPIYLHRPGSVRALNCDPKTPDPEGELSRKFSPQTHTGSPESVSGLTGIVSRVTFGSS